VAAAVAAAPAAGTPPAKVWAPQGGGAESAAPSTAAVDGANVGVSPDVASYGV